MFALLRPRSGLNTFDHLPALRGDCGGVRARTGRVGEERTSQSLPHSEGTLAGRASRGAWSDEPEDSGETCGHASRRPSLGREPRRAAGLDVGSEGTFGARLERSESAGAAKDTPALASADCIVSCSGFASASSSRNTGGSMSSSRLGSGRGAKRMRRTVEGFEPLRGLLWGCR